LGCRSAGEERSEVWVVGDQCDLASRGRDGGAQLETGGLAVIALAAVRVVVVLRVRFVIVLRFRGGRRAAEADEGDLEGVRPRRERQLVGDEERAIRAWQESG
jgi:hypothetical protein